MRLAILIAFLAIAIVACAPVEQTTPLPSETMPTDTIVQPQDEVALEHDDMNEQHEEDPHADVIGSDETMDPSEMSEVDVVFEVTGVNFAFTVNGARNGDMVVNQGDRVRVEFTSTQGVHDWVVDAFGATEIVQSGGSTFVEFVADQAGTFEYYCSVGSHRQQGMRGSFIVQ